MSAHWPSWLRGVAVLCGGLPVASAVGCGPEGPDAAHSSDCDAGEAIASGDQSARIAALESLAKSPACARGFVQRVTQMLRRDPAFAVRCEAARTLAAFGEHARDSTPELAAALTDDEPLVRVAAARALGKLHLYAAAEIPALIRFASADAGNDEAAFQALAKFGEKAAPALPLLIAALQERGVESAIWAIGTIGAAASDAVPALIDVLRSRKSDDEAREAAAWALGKIGPPALAAVPALEEAEARGVKNAARALPMIQAHRGRDR